MCPNVPFRASKVLAEQRRKNPAVCGLLANNKYLLHVTPTVWNALPILLSDDSDLVTVHPGRPAVLPTAAGWDEELRARTAGVRLPLPGHSESSFRTDPSVCPIMLRHRY